MTEQPLVKLTRSLADSQAVVAGTAAAVCLVAAVTASSDDGPVLCVFRRCSGGYCPGCGLSRSAGLLIRGDVAGSWARHPFLLVLMGQLLLVGIAWSAGSFRLRRALVRRTTTFVALDVVLLLAIWIARMNSGAIPLPFR